MTLLKNQAYLKDDEHGFLWVYEVDPEEWDFLKQKGTFDDKGNLVLSMPMIAALKKWNPNKTFELLDKYVQDLKIPIMTMFQNGHNKLEFPNLSNCTNSQLEEFITVYGGWRAFLESEVADLEARKSILESGFEEGLAKTLAVLTKQYREEGEKQPTKEALRGEALSTNVLLRKTRTQLIEVEAMFIKLSGIRNQYKAAYDTVSRIISLRSQEKAI